MTNDVLFIGRVVVAIFVVVLAPLGIFLIQYIFGQLKDMKREITDNHKQVYDNLVEISAKVGRLEGLLNGKR